MDQTQCERDVRALDEAAPGTTYGIGLGGPPFLGAPTIGSRIRLYCGADGALSWSYDDEGQHLVTGINRHPTLVDVRLRHL